MYQFTKCIIVPPELGNLGALENMALDGNMLSGAVPPELGDLDNLRILQLAGNELSGPVPPELGGLAELRQLTVSNNTDMAGELPAELTDLSNLNTLAVGGTELCAPQDPDFQAWLRGVRKRRVRTCDVSGQVYLTQAVQSREYPVPLVAGEGALLRVFLTASGTTRTFPAHWPGSTPMAARSTRSALPGRGDRSRRRCGRATCRGP